MAKKLWLEGKEWPGVYFDGKEAMLLYHPAVKKAIENSTNELHTIVLTELLKSLELCIEKAGN